MTKAKYWIGVEQPFGRKTKATIVLIEFNFDTRGKDFGIVN